MRFLGLCSVLARSGRSAFRSGPFRSGPFRSSVTAVNLAVVLAVFVGGTAGMALAQDEAPKDKIRIGVDGRYMKIVKSQYLPRTSNGKQGLKLTLDFLKALPTGLKMQIVLQYTGLAVETTEYEIADAKREGVEFTWAFENKLGPDDQYALQTLIRSENQTPKVVGELKKLPKFFPPEQRGAWGYTFSEPGEKISIGTKKELAALQETVCATYENFIADLAGNLADYEEELEKVMDGKKHVKGEALDTASFTKFLKNWMLEQAKIQDSILELQLTNPTIIQRSLRAYPLAIELGRMVSARAYEGQIALEKQYGITQRIKPKFDSKKKAEKIISSYNRQYNRATTDKHLQRVVERIYDLVCPVEEEEGAGEKDPGKKGDDTAGSSSPKKESESKKKPSSPKKKSSSTRKKR